MHCMTRISQQECRGILEYRPVVAAVSCDPVSFAKDARILADAGYGIDRLWVVDQFRFSPHVELVAALTHR